MYQVSVVISVLLALTAFSYNVWRMEVSEENNNIRTACFEILINLSSLEQLVYTAHYDGDLQEGSPRKGWVIVGLVNDLSALADESVQQETVALKTVWSGHWQRMPDNRESADAIVEAIDVVRKEIKTLLMSLE